jgi:uncharacterized protein
MASLGRRSTPGSKIHDYRDAISFAETLSETDGKRIGIWGSSYSGSHVLVVGAIDRRVKCVVSQAPMISGQENVRRLIRADFISGFQRMFEGDRRSRYAGNPPAMVPRLLEMVHRDGTLPGTLLEERGDPSLGRDALGI